MDEKELYINYDIEGNFWGNEGTVTKIKNQVSALDLKKEDTLNVIINTYGGEIFEAIGTRDYFKSLECNKSITVSGICASAGTEILLGFENRSITKGSFVMFHPAMSGVYGNRHEMQKVMNLLVKLDNEFILNYKKNLIVEVDNLEELIKNEWWLNADDFVKYFGGTLIDEIETLENRAKNTINETTFKNTLEKFNELRGGKPKNRAFNQAKFNQAYSNFNK